MTKLENFGKFFPKSTVLHQKIVMQEVQDMNKNYYELTTEGKNKVKEYYALYLKMIDVEKSLEEENMAFHPLREVLKYIVEDMEEKEEYHDEEFEEGLYQDQWKVDETQTLIVELKKDVDYIEK